MMKVCTGSRRSTFSGMDAPGFRSTAISFSMTTLPSHGVSARMRSVPDMGCEPLVLRAENSFTTRPDGWVKGWRAQSTSR